MKVINALIEGEVDDAVTTRLIEYAGHVKGNSYGKQGIDYIRKKIAGFNKVAQGSYYLVLVDFMDISIECPPLVVSSWLPNKNDKMIFRVVVREIESWILADRISIAKFLKVNRDNVPREPENLDDPKRELINIARRSRSTKVKEALIPDDGSTAQVGKLYTSELVRFIQEEWDISAARANAPSLDSCMRTLEKLK